MLCYIIYSYIYVQSYNYICFLFLVLLHHDIGRCQRRRLKNFLWPEKDPALCRFCCTKCYYPFPIRLLFPVSFYTDLDNTKFSVEIPHGHCFCKSLDSQQFTEKYIDSGNIFLIYGLCIKTSLIIKWLIKERTFDHFRLIYINN